MLFFEKEKKKKKEQSNIYFLILKQLICHESSIEVGNTQGKNTEQN